MGNSRWRLETTLDYLGAQAASLGYGPDAIEVIVTDWGSDVPLHEVVTLTPEAHRLTRFLHVPPGLARARQGASPFPEVLALNAAARRATGDFIGRIDQDTLVGRRFLAWCVGGAPDPAALYFANRRDLPYRLTAASPALGTVVRFVDERGGRMPVHRQNPYTGHLYWTSAVGIWLAARHLWHEAGGYDERLTFYNWMETDMIHRLRPDRPIVDLGAATDWDFYHLEHYHPVAAAFTRPHRVVNPPVDLGVPAGRTNPTGPGWGLADQSLPAQRAFRPGQLPATALPGAYAGLLFHLRLRAAFDAACIRLRGERERLRHRLRRIAAATSGQSAAAWPRAVWQLWTASAAARTAKMADYGLAPLRHLLARALAAAGMLAPVRRTRARLSLRRDPLIRERAAADATRYATFAEATGHVWHPLPGPRASRRALALSTRNPGVEAELGTLKAVQAAGFDVAMLLEDEQRSLRPFYQLVGAAPVHLWSDFTPAAVHAGRARALMRGAASLDDVTQLTADGIRVGRISACTILRDLRMGTLDLSRAAGRAAMTRRLAASLAAVEQAARILDAAAPDLLITEPEYTPKGELFELALARGIDVVCYADAHRRDTLMFKRYHAGNRDDHVTTLSPSTWTALQAQPWTPARRARVADEIEGGYRRGDWFNHRSTPTGPEPADAARWLGLDPSKKTAAVFPHVLWDAPVMWGTPLFPSYQEWFVRTMRVAYQNDALNWVVKLHPSHVWRRADEGYADTEETRVIEDRLGPPPPHVHLIPPETSLTTDALLRTVDYCLTVRGTVGVEAARLGIPVLTAGRARYTHHGFTVDSASAGEYLDRLRHLESQPPLDESTRDRADRFAYGAFVLRPWRLQSVTAGHDGRPRVAVTEPAGWNTAPDIRALAAWLASTDEDFLAADLG